MNKQVESEMFGYAVSIDCTEISNNDRYSVCTTEYKNKLVAVDSARQYADVASIFNFKDGDPVWVVWCEWNSGDSFSKSINSYAEAFGVFRNKSTASELAVQLRECGNQKTHELSFTTTDGQTHAWQFLPFTGYFENLSVVHVDCVLLGHSSAIF